MEKLSHVDDQGRARMVDVSGKPIQIRTASARGSITLNNIARSQITDALNKKGDVLTIAEIAGVQAVKKTPDLIPLCHPLLPEKIRVNAVLTETGVTATCDVTCHGRTGAEMEALTGVSVALLTVYDMCKAVDKTMIIEAIQVTAKEKQ